MVSEPANLVLVYPRLDEKTDRLIEDIRELRARVTVVVENLTGVQRRLDRHEVRLDRTEKRLDLVDTHH